MIKTPHLPGKERRGEPFAKDAQGVWSLAKRIRGAGDYRRSLGASDPRRTRKHRRSSR